MELERSNFFFSLFFSRNNQIRIKNGCEKEQKKEKEKKRKKGRRENKPSRNAWRREGYTRGEIMNKKKTQKK